MNPISKFGKKFARNRKGFTAVLVSIIVVVVAAIMLMITAVILSRVESSISRTGLSTAANDTLDAVAEQGFGALNLLTIVLVVTAAVAIIGAVIGIFAFIKMRQ
jgi:ABC-type phosphate transport system permease subunit